MRVRRPGHWLAIDWEAKAKENPLLAIMTTAEMADAAPEDFTPEKLEEFFGRGRKLYRDHLAPLLETVPAGCSVVEYGCGAGRILRPVADAGYRAIGIDISPTMLGHCARLVPEVEDLHMLDEEGCCTLPDGTASLVYSYSVLQHIGSLAAYAGALDEICRVLAPGGRLAIQVNCEDFKSGDPEVRWRTENHESFSLHYRPTKEGPYKRHEQDHWSGVYIGFDLLREWLSERGVAIERWYYHNPAKPRAIWVIGRKREADGQTAGEVTPDAFGTPGT